MPWNGAGQYVLPYDWTQDAANGLPISSTKMMAQENDIGTGMENCITRDNQTPPTANISWAGFKITSLANPTNAFDAANKGYVDAGAVSATSGTFFPYAATLLWLSATSFRVVGADATAAALVGRRAKITHNTGATVSYGTIVAAVFTGGNTNITVVMDAGTALVSTVTALSLGLEPSVPSALPRSTRIVAVMATSPVLSTVSNTFVNSGAFTVFQDSLGEFTAATGAFTAKDQGATALYKATLNCFISRNGGAVVNAAYTFRTTWSPTIGSVVAGNWLSLIDYVCLSNFTPATSLLYTATVYLSGPVAAAAIVGLGNLGSTYAGGNVTNNVGIEIERVF
jgi:hypothetical protein